MSDAIQRFTAIGRVIAGRLPTVLTATSTLLESIRDAVEDQVAPGELLDLLRRVLGWSESQLAAVNQAWHAVRDLAAGRTVLILHGAGSLVGVARRLHRATLGDQPLVVLGPDESAAQALERAAGGILFVEARHLPRDLEPLAAGIRDPEAHVRIVLSAASVEESARFAAMLPRVATISIPPLADRPDEIDRLIEAYGRDAMAELGAPDLGFRPRDLDWVRAGGVVTIDEIEEVARRLVALRAWGVTAGAKRLGISHGALSRWARRRRIPT